MDRLRDLALIVSIAASAPTVLVAGSAHQAFARTWEGRTVVLKQTLYSLVYNERGKLGNTYSGRRDGVTTVTPSTGVYFQFDGRQGRDDVVVRDPQRLVDAVRAAYEADSLDLRSYRKLDPVSLNRYEPGNELIVRSVRIDRDVIKLTLARTVPTADDNTVTSLTIKWPVPVSKSFEEREEVDAIIRQFLDVKRTS